MVAAEPSATYGRFASTASNATRHAVEQVGLHELDVQPERGRVGARHVERVGARRRSPTTDRSGRSSFKASATAPLPVPTSDDPGAAAERQRHLDQQLGLGPRDQHTAVDRQRDPPEGLAPEDVRDRLARLAPGHKASNRARSDGSSSA